MNAIERVFRCRSLSGAGPKHCPRTGRLCPRDQRNHAHAERTRHGVAAKAGDTFVERTSLVTSADGRAVTVRGQPARRASPNTTSGSTGTPTIRATGRAAAACSRERGVAFCDRPDRGNQPEAFAATSGFTVHLRGTDVTLLADPAGKGTEAGASTSGARSCR
jgi:hypothetical protein